MTFVAQRTKMPSPRGLVSLRKASRGQNFVARFAEREPSRFAKSRSFSESFKKGAKALNGSGCVGPTSGRKKSKDFTCSNCQAQFKSSKELRVHFKSHFAFLECEICKKKFRSVYYAKEHRKIHSGEKQFECSLCSYSCRQKGQLRSHEKRKHFRDYSFRCDVCGNGYHTRLELQVHNNSHTGERPHMCDVCGKSYPSKSNMMGHKRTHHPGKDGTVKRFPCESCDKVFVTKRSYQQHQRHHTGEFRRFLCDVCGKGLASREILKAHRLIHTGEKPVVCGICCRAFSRSKYLRVHMLTHTGEKPHRCEECGRCFTQRSTLVIHRRLHPKVQSGVFACGTDAKAFLKIHETKDHQRG